MVNKLANSEMYARNREYGIKTLFCEIAASLCLVSKTFTDSEVMGSF